MKPGPTTLRTLRMAPVPSPAPYVSVIDLDDFIFDDDDDELLGLPPDGPAGWVAPADPRPPVAPVLDLDAFLFDVNEPVEPPPGGPSGWASPVASTLDPTLSPAAIVYLAGPLTMLPSELVSQSRHALNGQVYMVYGASAAATAPRHSRPEYFIDIARQHIGRPDRILQDLQFPAPAFWPMTDSGATVNVVWDTELTASFRAQSHALRGLQGMASFAIGEAFLDVLVLAHVQNKGWSTKHLSSGDYDTWIVHDVSIQILSLTTLINQRHVVRIGGPTSGIFVAGRRDIFIPFRWLRLQRCHY
jgi:hypothetical protein